MNNKAKKGESQAKIYPFFIFLFAINCGFVERIYI